MTNNHKSFRITFTGIEAEAIEEQMQQEGIWEDREFLEKCVYHYLEEEGKIRIES